MLPPNFSPLSPALGVRPESQSDGSPSLSLLQSIFSNRCFPNEFIVYSPISVSAFGGQINSPSERNAIR